MIRIQTNIYWRKHKSGKVSWMVRWKCPVSGQWQARTAGRTELEATIVETKVRNALLMGQDPRTGFEDVKSNETVAELIEHYLKSPRFLSASPKWQEKTRGRLNAHIKPHFGKEAFATLNSESICNFYLKLREAGYGGSSIHKCHLLMCTLGDVHQGRSRTEHNPARAIKNFAKLFSKRSTKKAISFLTPDEIHRLIQAAAQRRGRLPLAPFCELLASTGLRREEAVELIWSDIDRGNGFLRVRDPKNDLPRLVPLELMTIKALDFFERYKRSAESPVVVSTNGLRPHIDSFLKPLKKAAALAGIEKRIDIHTLRHSYGSNKLREGWGLKKVSTILGHQDITMTADIYAHLLDGDLKVRDDYFQRRLDAQNGVK